MRKAPACRKAPFAGCAGAAARPAQPKLRIGPVNDPLEHEADRIADAVVSGRPAGPVNGASPALAQCASAVGAAHDVSHLSADRADGATSRRPAPTSDAEAVIASAGMPLSPVERAYFEPRFGHDFGGVRIHADARAAQSARELDAFAYTAGQDIVFAAGTYAPRTDTGTRLLAHELAHVVQQSHGPSAPAGSRELRRRPRGAGSMLDQLTVNDPIHAPVIADFRRRHGLPAGGVDEFGNPVGPSDAEIKYRLASGDLLPPCPDVKKAPALSEITKPEHRQAFLDTNCISPASQTMLPACSFTPDQEKMLAAAQKEASRRVERALSRITQGGAEGRKFAQELANRLFTGQPPTVTEALGWLNGVSGFLAGGKINFAGRTCGEPNCQHFAVVAYVLGPGQLPIYICPLAFSHPEELSRTILHEALHWAGLDADPATPEGYCQKFDCMSACQGKDTADAWAHYLDCLGQPLELRRSFVDKIVQSVEDIP